MLWICFYMWLLNFKVVHCVHCHSSILVDMLTKCLMMILCKNNLDGPTWKITLYEKRVLHGWTLKFVQYHYRESTFQILWTTWKSGKDWNTCHLQEVNFRLWCPFVSMLHVKMVFLQRDHMRRQDPFHFHQIWNIHIHIQHHHQGL